MRRQYRFTFVLTGEATRKAVLSSHYNSVPLYVRFDRGSNTLFTNVATTWGTYGYLNSIFCGQSTYVHLVSGNNNPNGAYNVMTNNFYFSVRCVKD